MEILFNKEGTPLAMTSQLMYVQSTGGPSNEEVARKNILTPYDLTEKNYVNVDSYQVMPWGTDNDFPQLANKQISTTSVLNTGLKFLRNLTIGQGIFPCTVEGYNDDGNEILKPITDTRIQEFLASRMVRRYMEKVLRDYLKYGNGAVHFIPSLAGNSFAGVQPINALYRRFTVPDSSGSEKCIISGYWPNGPTSGQYDAIEVLNDYDPEYQANILKFAGKIKRGFIFPVRDSWSNDDINGEPVWWPSYVLGWLEISHLIPTFLKKAYKNQITWKWHVQIPYSYWEKKFPIADFDSAAERKKAIQEYMDKVEANLCGVDNAEKPLFTNYAINEVNGKIEEEWKITALDNKYKGSDNLVTSAAANSEILFSLMVNPNVFGAGMPGGTYAGNQGGSNIREAFLVNIANAWIDRQNILDPLELYIKLNGAKKCDLRFRNTILVTLDTGSGTKKTLS